MAIEILPEIVDHPLTNLDGRVVDEDMKPAQEEIDEHQPHAGKQEQALSGPLRRKSPRKELASDDIIDDDLHGPRLEQFKSTDQRELRQGKEKAIAIGPEVTENLGSQLAHGLQAANRLVSSTGESLSLLATISSA